VEAGQEEVAVRGVSIRRLLDNDDVFLLTRRDTVAFSAFVCMGAFWMVCEKNDLYREYFN
jgi:hypothetical protein